MAAPIRSICHINDPDVQEWLPRLVHQGGKQQDGVKAAAIASTHTSETFRSWTTMKLVRRQFLSLAASAVVAPALSSIAWSQAYPTRPVRIVVGVATGGAPDVLARLIGRWLSTRLGQPFVIENRPGAGGNLATEAVVRASPDGYSLLLVTPNNAINETLYAKLNFNFLRDIAPVAGITRQPQVMLVNPSVPAATVPEFIAYAKAHPGKLNMASAGPGSGPHLCGELFKVLAGVDMVHVPYRGGALAITDLLGGQVQVMFHDISSIEHIRAGKLRALGTSTRTKSEALPDIPFIGDFVPGYETSSVFGVGAPKNTPVEIVDRLNSEINVALTDSNIKAALARMDGTALGGTPAEFGTIIADETEKWGKVVRFSGAKPD
jgi:tripartite-type tricarboxylate transporter receptor subunit TctC